MSNDRPAYAWPEWMHKYIEVDEVIRMVIQEGEKKNASEKHVALAILQLILDRETQWLTFLWMYKEKYGELDEMKQNKPLNITSIEFGVEPTDRVNGSEPE